MTDIAEVMRRPTVAGVARVLAQVAELLGRHEKRLDLLYDRLLLVDELPASAPFGALIRLQQGTVAERSALYLGNGPGQPLSKLTPLPL